LVFSTQIINIAVVECHQEDMLCFLFSTMDLATKENKNHQKVGPNSFVYYKLFLSLQKWDGLESKLGFHLGINKSTIFQEAL